MEIPLRQEKVRVRGLVRIAGWIFALWGGCVAFLGLYHSFFGEPEANYYSLRKWEFVTQEQWLRWSGFEVAYGLACAVLGWAALKFSERVPEWIVRPKDETESLF